MSVLKNKLRFSLKRDALGEIKLSKDILIKLKSEYEILQLNEKCDEIFPIGSRVEIQSDDGQKIEGRIWGHNKYKGEYSINRDGYKTTINLPAKMLKNLSVGYYGKLEREIWLFESRIVENELILKNSEFPEILNDERFNIIQVTKIEDAEHFECRYISFILAKNLRSSKFKIPQGFIDELGFYEIEVDNNEIINIGLSSKLAFEKSIKK